MAACRSRCAFVFIVLAILVPGGAVVWQRQTIQSLRAENATLQARAAEVAAMQQEIERLSRVQVDASELERLRNQQVDLMRLRAEITELRSQQRELEALRQQLQQNRATQPGQAASAPAAPPAEPEVAPVEATPAPEELPRESWQFAGYGDPVAALQSTFWAGLTGDVNIFMASLTPEHLATQQAGAWKDKTPEQIVADVSAQFARVNSVRILRHQAVSPTEVEFTLYLDGLADSEQRARVRFQRVGGDWKFAGNAEIPPGE